MDARAVPIWERKVAYFVADAAGVEHVELTTLWKHLFGRRGDRALAQTLRRRGHVGPTGTVPVDLPGLRRIAFPGQPGHAKDKYMPAATEAGLLELLPELDAEVLDANRGLLMATVRELGGDEAAGMALAHLTTRYPHVAMVDGGHAVCLVLRSGIVPRLAFFGLLKAFAPGQDPSFLFYQRGLRAFLVACGVTVPVPDATALGQLGGLASNQSDDGPLANPAFAASILPYERALAAKSAGGLVYGSCAYADGQPTLLADLPIVVLTLFRLRTVQARSLQAGAFHQGVVLMGGDEEVASAMAQHWRAEREAQPSNQLLEFLGLAVDHHHRRGEAAETNDGGRLREELLLLRATEEEAELRASYFAPIQIYQRPATFEAPAKSQGDLYGALVLQDGAYVAHKIGRSENFQTRRTQLDEEARRLHGKSYVHTMLALHKDCGGLERFIHDALAESRLPGSLKEYFVLPALSGPKFQEFLAEQAAQALAKWNVARWKEKEDARKILGDDARDAKRRKLDVALQAFRRRKELETRALEQKLEVEEQMRRLELEKQRKQAVTEEEERRLRREAEEEERRLRREAEEEMRQFEMEKQRRRAEAEEEEWRLQNEKHRRQAEAEEDERRLRHEGLELDNAKRRLELLALQRGLGVVARASPSSAVPEAWSDCVVVAENGFLDATRMAKAFGKKSNDYARGLRGRTLIAELQATIPDPLFRRIPGAHVWIHPSVALDFARWLDLKFGTWFAARQPFADQ